jgi:hypothetical protein
MVALCVQAIWMTRAHDLDDQGESTEPSVKTQDAEAAAAVETVEGELRDLPVLKQEEARFGMAGGRTGPWQASANVAPAGNTFDERFGQW